MNRPVLAIAVTLALVGCAGPQPVRSSGATAPAATPAPAPSPGQAAGAAGATAGAAEKPGAKGDAHVYKENRTGTPGLDRGVAPSKIEPTRTEAAVKFTVVDKDNGPISGLVIKLDDPRGKSYYTGETDAKGYAEVLVPVGQTYEVVYLSLGRRKIAAKLPVSDKPRLTIRLTLRYKRYVAPLVLEGVEFDTNRATLRPGSAAKLDRVVEYMTHKKSARIEISGHTDNVGNPKRNKALSRRRAQTCRKYIISKGIDGARIKAVGYGAERPIASNDTAEGRQQNRRIEANEL